MNLTRPDIKDLRKVTVKIICTSDRGEGSGTIVRVGEELFVLTAAHVIEREKGKSIPLPVEEIKVALYRNYEQVGFKTVEILICDFDKDVAVLKVENSNHDSLKGMEKVRLLAREVNGEATLCGFRKSEESLRINKIEQREASIWAVNIELSTQPIPPQPNFAGTSGGGVFYQDGDGYLYLAAFMTGVHTQRGNNNEIDCPSSMAFCEVEALKALVDDSEHQYVSDAAAAIYIESRTRLKPLAESRYSENQTGRFLENEKTKEIINILRDDDERTLLLTALSGMGKTKLIYEAFRWWERKRPNLYYAKYSGNEDDILGEAATFMKRTDEDGIIIVDDCPLELLWELVSRRNQCNRQFRIIAANHDYFNDKLEMSMEARVIRLSPDDMLDCVNLYIDEELPAGTTPADDINSIKDMAGGYPQMAIELVAAYKQENTAGVDVVEHLMPKLLNLDERTNANELTMMQTLSLCMPCPHTGSPKEAFKYLISFEHFTPLGPLNFTQRRSLAETLIRQYNPTLIDVLGDWLYVRPFPLAVWLTARWFKYVCNSSDHFKELIADIQAQDVSVQKPISAGFCKHIQQMHGNKAAFEMIGELVRRDVDDPFFNEEVLCSGLGSQLFLAMTTVNPAAIADCLYDIVNNQTIEWLRNTFNGDGRRNVVWGLEKLCFAKESYKKGVLSLARLAVAENESIGNNATAQLKQLFHIQLAGTEVDLKARLGTLRELVGMGEAYRHIALGCICEAFRNGEFMKMGGAEKFGFENKKDYAPAYWEEIFAYWFGCRDLLLEMLDKDPKLTDEVGKVVEENTFAWVRTRNWDILKPLLEKITELKGGIWEEEYEQLEKVERVFNNSVTGDISFENLKEWKARLRPTSFVTDLKEARHRLWASYKLKDMEMIELEEKLFTPLVDKFIQNGIYRNEDEIRLILNDKDYVDYRFAKKITVKMNHEEMNSLFAVVLRIILEGDNNLHSPFLFNFCEEARERVEIQTFLDGLYVNGKVELYVRLLAITENDELRNFFRVVAEEKTGKLPQGAIVLYLSHFRVGYKGRYEKAVKTISETFPKDYKLLVDFVLVHRIFMDHDEDVDCKSVIRNALVNYPVGDEDDRNFYEYLRLVVHILERAKDDKDFAKAINQKMIEICNKKIVHLNHEGVFTTLLRYYKDVVWEDFIEKFLSPDYYLFYFQVKDELGSGYGFGKGPLFEMGDELLKDLCLRYPESAPIRIASMAPCYSDNDDEKRFSDWFLWLLDKFGDNKDVRDCLHANLGSYFWTGTTIGLHKDNIQCYEKLFDHHRPEVAEWARKCANEEKMLLDREQCNEDFMELRYRR